MKEVGRIILGHNAFKVVLSCVLSIAKQGAAIESGFVDEAAAWDHLAGRISRIMFSRPGKGAGDRGKNGHDTQRTGR
ncbi:hypothetical protein D3C80_889080 [compost metagenome]|jgi:hypothetical protein